MYNNYNMMSPGGPSGMSITGKWMNKRTGETIFVRDNIISDSGMQVICDDGSVLSMTEFSRDYIQASDEIYNEAGNVIGRESATQMEITNSQPNQQQIHSLTEPLVTSYNQEDLYKEYADDVNMLLAPTVQHETPANNSNSNLIEKLFTKIESKPTINLSVEWTDFPKQELKTLVEYLDIKQEEVADYIYNNYVNSTAVKEEIANYLDKMLSK